mmetsp:Transcript_5939/g.10691  ORF Transcript_5939/g.10691 Transcript_5939/m.10691 type:complete len:275 (-) Transcript_5939:492-1316(-)
MRSDALQLRQLPRHLLKLLAELVRLRIRQNIRHHDVHRLLTASKVCRWAGFTTTGTGGQRRIPRALLRLLSQLHGRLERLERLAEHVEHVGVSRRQDIQRIAHSLNGLKGGVQQRAVAAQKLLRYGLRPPGRAPVHDSVVIDLSHVGRKVSVPLRLRQAPLKVLNSFLKPQELLISRVNLPILYLLCLELQQLQLLRREAQPRRAETLPLGSEPQLVLHAPHVFLEAHVFLLQQLVHGPDLHHLPVPCELQVAQIDGNVLWQPRLALQVCILLQ